MKPFFPVSFTAEIDALLAPPQLSALVPREPNEAARQKLESLRVEDLFEKGIADRDLAQACLAAVWLYHDFLDESHSISQQIDNREGSYWHGIMHRREPIDACETASRGSNRELLCREIQQCEWWLLFRYCFERACLPGVIG